ncbi:FitA-like ribbon-helix-helix domain-containing protein [Azospirillum rugosum]|uniref:Plasmid stability protein n=1 Tax=Azospirillum rugosum TaxID=416170 RepID=A0ABS4SS36_9PROT|nr:hypothetical protein [Azospirillum rugosum]MBP2295380.1 plasmid stability protein [Azospirillum rugosum]MDQ0528755.1 plasmid stability protein [Azospirillum rugosum]
MGRIVTLKLDDEIVELLRLKASIRGRSLEQELQDIAAEAARLTAAEKLAIADEICARTPPVPQTDSVDLLREDRDR